MKRNICARLGLVLVVCLSLTACETVGTTMTDLKNKISNIELPEFRTAQSIDAKGEDVAPNLEAEIVDCPQIVIPDELARLHQFKVGETASLRNSISNIKFATFDSLCKRNENNLIVDVNFTFEGYLGPLSDESETKPYDFTYPYFAALTSPSGDVITKEVFALEVKYEVGQNALTKVESLRQIIPVSVETPILENIILIGFQLSPTELSYNRALLGKDTMFGGNENVLGLTNTSEDLGASPVVEEAPKAASKPPVPLDAPKPNKKPEVLTEVNTEAETTSEETSTEPAEIPSIIEPSIEPAEIVEDIPPSDALETVAPIEESALPDVKAPEPVLEMEDKPSVTYTEPEAVDPSQTKAKKIIIKDETIEVTPDTVKQDIKDIPPADDIENLFNSLEE